MDDTRFGIGVTQAFVQVVPIADEQGLCQPQ